MGGDNGTARAPARVWVATTFADAQEAINAAIGAGEATPGNSWPLPTLLRVMPPIPVYDHKSMREAGRPRQHIVDPSTLDRTLCGKDFAMWRVVADPIETYDSSYFVANGCATCSKVARHIMEGRDRRAKGQGAGEL